jgi:hypothetical protein
MEQHAYALSTCLMGENKACFHLATNSSSSSPDWQFASDSGQIIDAGSRRH